MFNTFKPDDAQKCKNVRNLHFPFALSQLNSIEKIEILKKSSEKLLENVIKTTDLNHKKD